jgi:hypothetical protein
MSLLPAILVLARPRFLVGTGGGSDAPAGEVGTAPATGRTRAAPGTSRATPRLTLRGAILYSYERRRRKEGAV